MSGAALLARAFPAGTSTPTEVIVPDAGRAAAVVAALRRRGDIASSVTASRPGAVGVRLAVVLRADPLSTAAQDRIPVVRAVTKAGGAGGLADPRPRSTTCGGRGGATPRLVVPLALAVVLAILVGLLRALVRPLLVIITVIASYAAALGVAAAAFGTLFGFTGSDSTLPLISFVCLFALGVDDTVFLVARTREEARAVGTGSGMTRALGAAGAVITSAGRVLTGTFALLGVLPLVALVPARGGGWHRRAARRPAARSVIVPALVDDLGPRVWWPSRLDGVGSRPLSRNPPPPRRGRLTGPGTEVCDGQ